MSTTFQGDRCVCGGFKYAGHRCPPPAPAGPSSELNRLLSRRQLLRDVADRVRTSRDLMGWVQDSLMGLVDTEQQRIAGRLAELETENADAHE